MGKNIKLSFKETDMSILKWINDWHNLIGDVHLERLTQFNNDILDFKTQLTGNCPDLADTFTITYKADFWENENKEHTN